MMDTYDPAQFSDVYSTDLGERIWRLLNEERSIDRMLLSSKLKRPAVEGIDELLLDVIGEDVRQDRVKQMIGHMVRQIMERQGLRIDMTGVRIRTGSLFSSGARYK